MIKLVPFLSILVISSTVFAAGPASFVLSCKESGTWSKLVATNSETGEKIEGGTFGGGGWVSSEASRESTANCLAGLTIQAPCVSQTQRIYACDVRGTSSALVVTSLLTGQKIDSASFSGGGWGASEILRESMANCLIALKAQASCQ